MDHEARAREISPNIMREITWKIELAKLFSMLGKGKGPKNFILESAFHN
jgi:hypothetical protein